METLNNSVLVIGNGQSRKGLDLSKFHLPIIGCNALHRDIIPDYLICCDRKMAEEATLNSRMKNSTIYVRKSWHHYFRKIKKNKNVIPLPSLPYQGNKKQDNPDNWGSGCYALLVAANLQYENICLIGFDLYSLNHLVNNIYKGTANYKKEDDLPIDPQFWIYQIEKIFQIYRTKKFIIFNDDNWILPDNWLKPNVELRNIRLLRVDIK